MMNDKQQTNAFSNDIDALVTRYAHEFDVSYAAVIGSLLHHAIKLSVEASKRDQKEK